MSGRVVTVRRLGFLHWTASWGDDLSLRRLGLRLHAPPRARSAPLGAGWLVTLAGGQAARTSGWRRRERRGLRRPPRCGRGPGRPVRRRAVPRPGFEGAPHAVLVVDSKGVPMAMSPSGAIRPGRPLRPPRRPFSPSAPSEPTCERRDPRQRAPGRQAGSSPTSPRPYAPGAGTPPSRPTTASPMRSRRPPPRSQGPQVGPRCPGRVPEPVAPPWCGPVLGGRRARRPARQHHRPVPLPPGRSRGNAMTPSALAGGPSAPVSTSRRPPAPDAADPSASTRASAITGVPR